MDRNGIKSFILGLSIFGFGLGIWSGAEARTQKGRTATELEKPIEWGEAPEDTTSPEGNTGDASANELGRKKRGRRQAGDAGAEGGAEKTRVLGASETMDKLFPTPTPETNSLDREIKGWIRDLGGENHQRQNAVERLSSVGKPAVQPLKQALKDPYKFTRVGALAALANIRDKATIPEIEAALDDKTSEVRAEAAKSLGKMRSKTSLELLSKRLWDSDVRVRREVVIALGRIKTSDARDLLLSALETSDYLDVRQQAAQDLANFSGNEVVQALLKATHEKDVKLCAFAIHALGEIGDPAARSRLEELSRNRDRSIREEAVEAIKNLE